MCGKGAVGGITHAGCRLPLGMDGLASVFPYRDGIQDAVKRLKYRFVREMGEALVKAADERIDKGTVSFFRRERFVVVPIPLHKARERWRGFNQAALLGKLLAEYWELDFRSLLLREKNTEALAELRVRLAASEREVLKYRYRSITLRKLAEREIIKKEKEKLRKAQMLGAFNIDPEYSGWFEKSSGVRGLFFLLVDDVWTSGATMLECCKLLKRKGAKQVWGFTFARSGW